MCGIGGVLTVVSVKIQDYDVRDRPFIRVHLSAAGETCPFLLMFQYARDLDNCLYAQRVILGMQLYEHDFYMLDCNTVCPPALGHGLVDGYIRSDAERLGAAVIVAARIHRSTKCVRKTDTSIVCPPCLVIYSCLLVEKTRLRILSFHTWIPAV